MAIKPPSDLVLDVSRAADPLEYRASVEKLRNAQSAVRAVNQVANGNSFAQLTNADGITSETLSNHQVKYKLKPEGGDNVEAYKKFEAFMLQTFIQNMFTTDTPSVFGKGQAGEFWKSMMAESMAKEMADHGGIGVAKMLENNQQTRQASVELTNELNSTHDLGTLARASKNPQATIDNIVHSNEINLVRQRMTKNT